MRMMFVRHLYCKDKSYKRFLSVELYMYVYLRPNSGEIDNTRDSTFTGEGGITMNLLKVVEEQQSPITESDEIGVGAELVLRVTSIGEGTYIYMYM